MSNIFQFKKCKANLNFKTKVQITEQPLVDPSPTGFWCQTISFTVPVGSIFYLFPLRSQKMAPPFLASQRRGCQGKAAAAASPPSPTTSRRPLLYKPFASYFLHISTLTEEKSFLSRASPFTCALISLPLTSRAFSTHFPFFAWSSVSPPY